MSKSWIRYLIEWGCGGTLRHEDPELAAKRAVENAMAHTCPLDFESLGGIDMSKDLRVEVVVGVPFPEKVSESKIADLIPYNCGKEVKITSGGLVNKGVRDEKTGRLIDIIIAVAYVTLYVRKKSS